MASFFALAISAMRQRLRQIVLRLIGALLQALPTRLPGAPTRILVIRPDHLGDVLLLTPALRLLRQQLPVAHITLLIGPWSAAAIAHNPDVDTVITCPFPGFTRTEKPSLLQPYLLLFKMALLLRGRGFDAALVTRDDHWWGALLAAAAGIPRRFGYALPEVNPFLTDALQHTFDMHVTAQSTALVEALTGSKAATLPQLRAPISPADTAWAVAWLEAHAIERSRPLAAVHPGSGGMAKLWPSSYWRDLIVVLQEQGLQVLVTGGAGEHELVATIVDGLAAGPHLLLGEATIGQLAALYCHCSVVLGVDSGPLHLAATTGVQTVALFGPGNHRRFGPWGPAARHVVVRSGLWCSPCGVLDHCPRGTAPSECMTLISVGDVRQVLEQLRVG